MPLPAVVTIALRAVLLLAGLSSHTLAQAAPSTGDSGVTPPHELLRRSPAEPYWGPLFRLQALESRYAADAEWADTYFQLLGTALAGFGDPLAALRVWNSRSEPAGGDTAAARRLVSRGRLVPAVDTILRIADTARVVMINERHHASADRLLTLELLDGLWERGYRYFAAEALPRDDSLTVRGFSTNNSVGFYFTEPVYAELVRAAVRRGFRLVPYEMTTAQRSARAYLPFQRRRDLAQAENLIAGTLAVDPDAKILVHAGYDHVVERERPYWKSMAQYFRELTGIDPVTIDQVLLGSRGDAAYEHPVLRVLDPVDGAKPTVVINDSTGRAVGAISLGVDLTVLRGMGPLEHGRPAWLSLGGRRVGTMIAVPECARRRCVVEAHRAEDLGQSIAADRVRADSTTAAWLYLPKEAMRIVIADADGLVLREERRWPDAPAAGHVVRVDSLERRTRSTLRDDLGEGLDTLPVGQDVDLFRVLYATDVAGRRSIASALIAVPVDRQAVRGVMVYLHGSTLTRSLSPSEPHRVDGNQEAALFASNGAITVVPDYVGLGRSPEPQAFLLRDVNVTTTLDLLRAVRSLAAARGWGWRPTLGIMGFSQGGHLAAALHRRLEQTPIDGYALGGTLAVGAPFDLQRQVLAHWGGRDDIEARGGIAFTAMSYAHYLGQPLQRVLAEPARTSLPVLLDGFHEIGEIAAGIPASLGETFAPEMLRVFENERPHWFRRALAENSVAPWAARVPLRVLIGTADTNVDPRDSQGFVAASQRLGGRVTLREFDGANHPESLVRAYPEAWAWFNGMWAR
jgi:acetyl esterase/lipase